MHRQRESIRVGKRAQRVISIICVGIFVNELHINLLCHFIVSTCSFILCGIVFGVLCIVSSTTKAAHLLERLNCAWIGIAYDEFLSLVKFCQMLIGAINHLDVDQLNTNTVHANAIAANIVKCDVIYRPKVGCVVIVSAVDALINGNVKNRLVNIFKDTRREKPI